MSGSDCDHHHHHHHHQDGTKNIAVAFALNAGFALIELVGGYFSHSVAIQANAVHDLGDSAALAGALVLQFIAAAPPRSGYSYGFRRLSLLAAMLTAGLLLVGSFYVVLEAVERFEHPIAPQLGGMFCFALLGVVVNGYAAWRMSSGNTQNEKALAWHMLGDLLGWVAVLISSIIMGFVDAPWIDPALSMAIAFLVLYAAGRNLWATLRLFLQAVPRGIDEENLRRDIAGIVGVKSLNSLRIWSLDGEHHVCTIQVDVAASSMTSDWEKLKKSIQHVLKEHGEFDVTIEPKFIPMVN